MLQSVKHVRSCLFLNQNQLSYSVCDDEIYYFPKAIIPPKVSMTSCASLMNRSCPVDYFIAASNEEKLANIDWLHFPSLSPCHL